MGSRYDFWKKITCTNAFNGILNNGYKCFLNENLDRCIEVFLVLYCTFKKPYYLDYFTVKCIDLVALALIVSFAI